MKSRQLETPTDLGHVGDATPSRCGGETDLDELSAVN